MISNSPNPLTIGQHTYNSRLLVGTGKFSSNESMKDALRASGSELVTVALKRANLGADAVLVNTAIASASDPSAMARVVEAGREAYEIGIGQPTSKADASSPLTAFLNT